MGYRMDLKDADRMFAKLQEEYEIWAPKRFVGKGRYSDTDLIKYARVDRAEEIEYREKSDFPAKEVLSPITQSLFYFTEDEFIESKAVSRRPPVKSRNWLVLLSKNKKGPLSGPVRSENASGLHLTPISQKPSGQAGPDFPAVNRYS